MLLIVVFKIVLFLKRLFGHLKVTKIKKGCPLGNDPVEIAHKMAEKGITLYCAGCEPSLTPYRQFFIALCLITGGQYVPLNQANNLTSVIKIKIIVVPENTVLSTKDIRRSYRQTFLLSKTGSSDKNSKNDQLFLIFRLLLEILERKSLWKK